MTLAKDFVPRLYSPEDVRELFRMKNLRSVYRAASGGFLAPFVRRFDERHILFDRAGVDKFIEEHR